jgi:hypothetical protein
MRFHSFTLLQSPLLGDISIFLYRITERKVIEPTEMKPSITKPSNSYPTAVVIPGRPGMVFSPYNNRVIDCIGMRSGSLVMDPQYPREEKKWFIVP